jgi:ketosteroid isomerase-like protein
MIQGREGIEAYWGGGFQMGIKDIVLTTVDVMGMGDMVCEIGKAVISIQPEGMDAIEDMAKYLVVWKKGVDGSSLVLDASSSSDGVESGLGNLGGCRSSFI